MVCRIRGSFSVHACNSDLGQTEGSRGKSRRALVRDETATPPTKYTVQNFEFVSYAFHGAKENINLQFADRAHSAQHLFAAGFFG